LLLVGFVYWQAAVDMTSKIDGLLTAELRAFASDPLEQRLAEIEDRLRYDPRRVRFTGRFDTDGHRIAGNMESLPPGLMPDVPGNAIVVRIDGNDHEIQNVRLAAHPLPDGEVVVVGRNIDEIADIAEIVGRALGLGLLPALGLAVVIGIVLSLRGLKRLSEVNRRIQRIVAGDLRRRLPTRGATTHSTSSPSASIGCSARLRGSSMRFPV
jgi:hypothetical protein